jgi:diguanylate cyclase (GGDEF)-like protein
MEVEQQWSLWLIAPALLGLVAAVGFVLGRRRPGRDAGNRAKNRHEILRALTVAQELESITYRLRKALAVNIPAVAKFSARLARLENRSDLSWHDLCDRADSLLKPALSLSTEISHAYAELLQQMTHLSTFADLRTDPLTGAANRRAFDESLGTSLAQQARHGTPLTLAMVDIDFFKQINDLQGHLQGDRVLQSVVELLKREVRECDLLARYGGDEFAILMPHTELPAACNVTERIRASVQQKLSITISIGLAASTGGDTPTSFLGRADAALYRAKNAGRNCVYLHEGSSDRIIDAQDVRADIAACAEATACCATDDAKSTHIHASDTGAIDDELKASPQCSA